MILTLSVDKANVVVKPEDANEVRFLEKFPGFLQAGLLFYAPAKPNLIRDLYLRLVSRKVNIKYTRDVLGLIEKQELKELPEDFKYHTKPLEHQDIALRFGYTHGCIGLLLEPGLGKTKVFLDFLVLMKIGKAIVACPKPLRFVWEDEAATHRPELKVYVVKTTDWKVEEAKCREADLVVVNYDKAVSMGDKLASLKAEAINIDEGLIKNYQSERCKALTKLGHGIKYRWVASGTLINTSPLDAFAPMRFCEPSLFGTRATDFKKEYCVTLRNNENVILGFKKVPEISRALRAVSIVMKKEEWLKSLPEKKIIRRIVPLSDEQRRVYHSLASNYMVDFETSWGKETLEIENPLTITMKLNQIANGFLYVDEQGEDSIDWNDLFGLEPSSKPKAKKAKGVRKTHFFKDQFKITELIKLLTTDLARDRTLVWFNMTAEAELIEKALNEAGIKYVAIKGGEKDVGGKVRSFNKDETIKVLLCQARTINYGVTTMGHGHDIDESDEDLEDEVIKYDPRVRDEVFYSMNFSLEIFLQQQDRIHRIGQTRECRYWILLTSCPVEKRIMDRMEERLECNNKILIDISKDLSGLT